MPNKRNAILTCLLALALVIGISTPMDVKAEGKVAEVTVGQDTTEYQTLQEAVSAVNNSGGTLKFLENVQLDSKLVFSGSNNIVVDLNEKEISSSETFQKKNCSSEDS